MLMDKKPTHKQHGKPKGLTSPKGRGTPTEKDLRAEKDRKDRCDRGLRIDIIDGMGRIGGLVVKMGEW